MGYIKTFQDGRVIEGCVQLEKRFDRLGRRQLRLEFPVEMLRV